MSNIQQIKSISSFAEAALALDGNFGELERLSGQLERLDIETDAGLEKAKELLARFGEKGQSIGDGVQLLAKELDEARIRAEKAAELVTKRAVEIQERQNLSNQLHERFQSLAEMVRKVSALIAQLKKAEGEMISDDERSALMQKLPEFDTQLGVLVGAAEKLREEALDARMKGLVRNADSLAQTLVSARRKLGSVSALTS